MQTEFMLLAIYNKPRLSLGETCQALGMSTATGYTHRSLGKFPVAMSGNPLTADIRDVAVVLDQLRHEAPARIDPSESRDVQLMRDEIARMKKAISALEEQMASVQKADRNGMFRGGPDRYLRLSAVIARVGLGRTTIYQYIKEGKFPAPTQLGPRAVAWEEAAITEWQPNRISGVKTRTAAQPSRRTNAVESKPK